MTNKFIVLDKDEFVPYAPEKPGSVRIYHCKHSPGKNKLFDNIEPGECKEIEIEV